MFAPGLPPPLAVKRRSGDRGGNAAADALAPENKLAVKNRKANE